MKEIRAASGEAIEAAGLRAGRSPRRPTSPQRTGFRAGRSFGKTDPSPNLPFDGARVFRRVPLCLLVAIVPFLGCGNGGAPADVTRGRAGDVGRAEPGSGGEGVGEGRRSSGHRRMLDLLEEVRRRTRAENHWLGAGPMEEARRRLALLSSTASPARRWRMLLEVAEHELRMGEERAAIDHFLEAYRLLPALEAAVPQEERLASIFRLGVAWLRYGETRNCSARHNAASCILPIRDEGLHAEEEGSRQAIRYFEELLERTPRQSPLNVKTVWLLNFAYMTVGGYPHEVPRAWLVPPEVLASEEDLPRFRNVAPELGLATFNLSGGAVLEDLDGDADLDLFTTSMDTAAEPRFFRNEGDGSFSDRSQEAGLGGLYGGLNVVHADYDNDGDLDLYVLRGGWLYTAGRHPNSLLRNDGAGRFTDVTFEAGLGEVHYPTQTAAWADYDNDGDLDLYVGNEHGDGMGELADPTPDFAAPSQLFRNRGDGTFVDVAPEAGVAVREYVKGVVWGDVDEDRWPDLYLSILGAPNRLFRNRGDGTFGDVALEAGVEEPVQSFPVWFWDYDNDGHLDLMVWSYRGFGSVALVAASYFGQPVPWELPKLYRGDGRGGFENVAPAVGLDRLHLPMGSNFGDFDGDGFLDFYLGTGYPDYEAVMPNVLYHNQSGEWFADVTIAAGLGHLQKGHAVAFGDVDGDGDLDIFEQMGGAFPGDRFADALYRNPGFGNRWLGLRLVGVESNRSAIGARIRVDLLENGRPRSIHRRVTSGGSFGGNPLRQTLGLGRASRIEGLEVYWPTSDLTQTFTGLEADRIYVVTEGREPAGIAGGQSP